MFVKFAITLTLCLGFPSFLLAESESSVLDLPPGFQATLFAGDELASDVQCMTVNAKGQIVVSGPGYIRILIDQDGDGRAESAKTFADRPATGAQGLCVDGSSYYCIGDEGLLRFVDEDGDNQADGPPELVKAFRTGGEHFTHALRQGPDGDWYLIAGNEAQITSSTITSDRSPIDDPQAGTMMRLTDDFRNIAVIADGFRNAYDFDFNAEGDLFSYDSDGERDISLPYYRPTRVFHSITSMTHGWVTRSWKKPNYFPEMSPVVAELGRGSPTGVVTYRHTQFPPEFQNTVFVLDWTYGRMVAVKLKRQGSSWVAQDKQFAGGHGDYGFAPTDAVVGPEGAMYVCVGGRGTQGSVFRITYEGEGSEQPVEKPAAKAGQGESAKLNRVLNAPQPLSAWSRAQWEPAAEEIGEEDFIIAALDRNRSDAQRMRAIEVLTDLFQGPDVDFMLEMTTEENRELRARAVWAYGRSVSGHPNVSVMEKYLDDNSPVVVRSALEAMTGCTAEALVGLEEAIAGRLGDKDRVVRQLAVNVSRRLTNESFRELGEVARRSGWPEAMQMARAFVDRGYVGHSYVWHDIALEALRRLKDPEELLTAVLLIQHSFGGYGDSPVHDAVFDGYLPRLPLPGQPEKLQALTEQLAVLFPQQLDPLDWELARLIATLQPNDPELLAALLAQINDKSTPVSDVHYLICSACLPAARTTEQSQATASALLGLFTKQKEAKADVDRNWQPRLQELYSRMVTVDPELPRLIAEHEDFGEPEHTIFVSQMQGEVRQRAVLTFLQRVQAGDLELTPEVLALLSGMQSEQALRIARQSLDNPLLRPTAMMLLAEANHEEDRAALLDGLTADQWEIVSNSLEAQQQWEQPEPVVMARLTQLLKRLADEDNMNRLWDGTLSALERQASVLTRQFDTVPAQGPEHLESLGKDRPAIAAAWQEWVVKNFPDLANQFAADEPSEKWASWEEQFAGIDWSTGAIEAGKVVFQKQQCAQCHEGRNAVGPNLQGIMQRFSTRDLMIAIVDPHRDVSSRYRTTMIVTDEGKTYTGIVIYESVDGLLLRDATHQTVRIESDSIEFRKELDSSLMPENLLKGQSPQQIADLFAYLRSLGGGNELTKKP